MGRGGNRKNSTYLFHLRESWIVERLNNAINDDAFLSAIGLRWRARAGLAAGGGQPGRENAPYRACGGPVGIVKFGRKSLLAEVAARRLGQHFLRPAAALIATRKAPRPGCRSLQGVAIRRRQEALSRSLRAKFGAGCVRLAVSRHVPTVSQRAPVRAQRWRSSARSSHQAGIRGPMATWSQAGCRQVTGAQGVPQRAKWPLSSPQARCGRDRALVRHSGANQLKASAPRRLRTAYGPSEAA
jgi:hypothetical protein